MRHFYLILLPAIMFGGFAGLNASEDHDHEHEEDKKPAVQSPKDDPDAKEDHDSHEKKSKGEDSHSGHEEESKGHGHGDSSAHEGGENPQVGPKKGILAASEEQGIKLSPEAEKNFEIAKLKIATQANFEIPKTAIVTAGIEVNLYRYREGFYKRIDFELVSRTATGVVVHSKELKIGDEIAVTGLGFLRIAEIAAFGGAPEGHSH